MIAKPYAPLQLTVKRPPTEAEKAQVVREVLAANLGVPVDMVPAADDPSIRELVALVDEIGPQS